jgi:hypothetical protein
LNVKSAASAWPPEQPHTRREFQNFGVRADFHDNAVADRDGLGYGIVGIHGEDVAVNEDEVGDGILRGEKPI